LRASLLHPLREPRHARRHRRRRGRGGREQDAQAIEPDLAEPITETTVAVAEPAHPCDPAAQRVRQAGGPVDLASYTCSCGYLFSASVSTSVVCPHCGADQAW
jgi:hypothetical protein